ncbi:MAG: GNAT family N-acetyltransferase [Candidatus Thorarchaeota archaeon]
MRLRKLNPSDAPTILPHWNVYDLDKYLPISLPMSNDDMVRYIESVNEAFENNSMLTFGIETLEDNQLIGIISLANISWISRFGEIGHFAIFDLDRRGKGYGADALRVLLNMAFSVLELHSVYLWVEAFNNRAIRFYEKIGFKSQGRLRELGCRDGKRHDVVIMDILGTDFLGKYDLPRSGSL